MPADLPFGSLTGSCLANFLVELRLTLLRDDTAQDGTGFPTSINNQEALSQTQTQANIIWTTP